LGCGKKEKPSGKKAFVSKLEILRPVLGGAQGRRHLRFPLQGVVLVFFTGVPLGLLAQGAYHFPFLPAVVLAVGTAGLDIPPKEGLLFLFAEPSHRRPFLSLATGLDITPAVGTSRRRLKPPDWPEVPTSRPAFAFSAAMIPYTCGGHVAQAAEAARLAGGSHLVARIRIFCGNDTVHLRWARYAGGFPAAELGRDSTLAARTPVFCGYYTMN